MNIKLLLTDEEAGYLYGNLYRQTVEADRYKSRRRFPRTAAEKAAREIAVSLRRKLRKSLPRGAARAIEVLSAQVM